MNEPPLDLDDTIMEVREDFMLSPAGDSKPTLRTAHFLKPIANTIEEPAFEVNPFSSSASSVFKPNEWPLKFHFNGWRHPQEKWVRWVYQLKLKYESLWKQVGIFEAIMTKVLNCGRGHGRGRVKDFAISAVTAVALRITIVAL
ncbi:serine/threonine-protein phosphatase 7 long form protein [Trifolium repens]|nr:serine/threonine-protein phosphatase 7 long form protein [Trifolium repens]